MKRKYSVDIAVGGRFHADRFMQAVMKAGHTARLLTSYPASRFPAVPKENLSTHTLSEALYRGLKKVGLERSGEQAKMVNFGQWVSRKVKASTDLAVIWSSFGYETFKKHPQVKRVVVRDSTHILHQASVLMQEFHKVGKSFVPDPVCIERELAEYHEADRVIVLSQFAKQTLVEHGVFSDKIDVMKLGVNTELFRPQEREKLDLPLRILYFGTLSIRKGTHYLLEATKNLPKDRVTLDLVGPIEDGFETIFSRYTHATYHPPMPHAELAPYISQFHVYAFPTLEDGFPMTLIQAMAAGLIPITTRNNGPAELITENREGWFVEPGNSEALTQKIEYACNHLEELFSMRAQALKLSSSYTWHHYDQEIASWIDRVMQSQPPALPPYFKSQENSKPQETLESL